ncbi:hypothetical protein ABZ805_15835, partial [Saccharopolyspora sp. NPDC047091]|uniref:hypothetical protein n=1 Tax=Saccharopolyspora sp. NPDC047091 TaxID=3155924 RepID=UPI0033FC2D2D
ARARARAAAGPRGARPLVAARGRRSALGGSARRRVRWCRSSAGRCSARCTRRPAAAGLCRRWDTIVARAVADGPGFPRALRTVGFREPLHDMVALVRTRELAHLAQKMLLDRPTPER